MKPESIGILILTFCSPSSNEISQRNWYLLTVSRISSRGPLDMNSIIRLHPTLPETLGSISRMRYDFACKEQLNTSRAFARRRWTQNNVYGNRPTRYMCLAGVPLKLPVCPTAPSPKKCKGHVKPGLKDKGLHGPRSISFDVGDLNHSRFCKSVAYDVA